MKISVIMATYNAQETIRQAIESVIGQSYPQKELILIDGGSTDGTPEIIKEYETHVAYWSSEPDDGVYDAMNKGIAKATGDVIAFLNSDDWYEPEIFGKISDCFAADGPDILVCMANCVLGDHVYRDRESYRDIEDLQIHMIYYHQGMFAKREVFERIGTFDLRYQIVADYDWTLRAYRQGCRFQTIPDAVVNYRCDGFSSIQSLLVFEEVREIACAQPASEETVRRRNAFYGGMEDRFLLTLYNLVWKKDGAFVRSLCREGVSWHIWGAGAYGRMSCKLFWSVGIAVEGFIDNDRTVRECYGYSVLSPEELTGAEWICIGSRKYEKEIREQILAMGYPPERIISFTDFKSSMIEYGKKHYMNDVMQKGRRMHEG